MTDDNVTPFVSRTPFPPASLFENPTVPEAMETLMQWTAWRIRLGDSPPSEYYRLHQLRDAIIHLSGDRRAGETIEVTLP